MKKGYTDITILVDRSGSMEWEQDDTEDQLNAYVRDLKNLEGDVRVSFYVFDSIWDLEEQRTNVDCIFSERPLESVPRLRLEPRGGTPLLDALGRVINATGSRLHSKPECSRPDRVLFVIITDGGENTSHEFSMDQIREMMKHQQDKYNWNFVYLGANQDSIAEESSVGIVGASSMTYNQTQKGLAANTRHLLYHHTVGYY